MTDTQLIDKIGQLIDKLDRPHIPLEIALWDAKTCAAYFGVTSAHFRDRMACKPNFPAPHDLPTEGGRGTPRWKASEVIAYAETLKRQKKAA